MADQRTVAAHRIALTAATFVLTGCSRPLADVDARARQLAQERSAAIGGGAVAPELDLPDDVPNNRRASTTKSPSTVNPDASALTFDPASESRDVASRLAAYAERSTGRADNARKLTLTDAFKEAQRSAREFIDAEEDYILAAIRLLVERHLWGPRLFNDTTLQVAGQGDDGDFESAVSVINTLRVTKRLPYGGEVAAAWVWTATEQLRQQATGRYRQSSELVLSGNIPLLRGAGLVAQEGLIQAERDLVYAARTFEDFRRQFLVGIAADYFDLLQARAQIRNQEAQLDSLRLIERGQTARFEAGRIAEFDKNIAVNQVLEATAGLAGQRESYILQLERFKIRLGLPSESPIEIDDALLEIPDPDITLEEASRRALEYRLDVQTRRDQLDDAARSVANARNALLPSLDATAQVGIPTDPDAREGGINFQPDDLRYSAGITFGLPLDRETERLGLRQAIIGFRSRQRAFDQFRDEVAVGVRQAVRNIDLARFQLRLAEEQVAINQRRMRELEIKADEVDTQQRVDAANELQRAANSRDRTRTNLRNAILNYLRDSGQLRVARDGTFQPLPGMGLEAAQ
ncbi:MAG: TolC family protein [Phycisphaerales bacterium]